MHQPSNAPTADNNDEVSSGTQKKVQFDDELDWDEWIHKSIIDVNQNNRRTQTAKRHTKNPLKDIKEINQLNEDRKRRKQRKREKMVQRIEQLTWMVYNWHNLSLLARSHLKNLAEAVEGRLVDIREVPTVLRRILDDNNRQDWQSNRNAQLFLTWAYSAARGQGVGLDDRPLPVDDVIDDGEDGDTADDAASETESDESRNNGNVATVATATTSINNNTDATTNNDNNAAATDNNDNNAATNHASTTNSNNNRSWWQRLWRR